MTSDSTHQEELGDRAVQWVERELNATVLRRALMIATAERVGFDQTPDAGLSLVITWVIQAADEIERNCDFRAGGQCDQRRAEREP